MYKEAKKIIKKSKNIYIVGHINPDGDAIGSAFALYFALNKIGKNAKVIMPEMSEDYSFLPRIDTRVNNVEEEQFDLLICLDSSSRDRLPISEEDFNKAKAVLMIDHHKIANAYGDVICIDDTAPATCELVYNVLRESDIIIDEEIATYLYLGIMTDTGSFNYKSTKPSTHKIVSELLKTGFDFYDICRRLNDTMKEGKLLLIAKTINNMEVLFDGRVRYSYVDYETINSLNLSDEDAEGMTKYLRKPTGTELAVYVRQKQNGENKVSMRSGGNVDVSKIAIFFGGGGHKRAAGYTMQSDNYNEEKKRLMEQIAKEVI